MSEQQGPSEADQKTIDDMISDCMTETTADFLRENRDEIVKRARKLMFERMQSLSELPGA